MRGRGRETGERSGGGSHFSGLFGYPSRVLLPPGSVAGPWSACGQLRARMHPAPAPAMRHGRQQGPRAAELPGDRGRQPAMLTAADAWLVLPPRTLCRLPQVTGDIRIAMSLLKYV